MKFEIRSQWSQLTPLVWYKSNRFWKTRNRIWWPNKESSLTTFDSKTEVKLVQIWMKLWVHIFRTKDFTSMPITRNKISQENLSPWVLIVQYQSGKIQSVYQSSILTPSLMVLSYLMWKMEQSHMIFELEEVALRKCQPNKMQMVLCKLVMVTRVQTAKQLTLLKMTAPEEHQYQRLWPTTRNLHIPVWTSNIYK